MSTASIYRWHDGVLHPLEHCDTAESRIVVADSWLVAEGRALALDLHRDRFLDTATDGAEFWEAAIALIPRTDDWFPRVELQNRNGGGQYLLRLRSAPALSRSVRLASAERDPRTTPGIKGPDTDALLSLRTAAQQRGADEAVILSPDGYVVEGAYSGLLWWRGDALCAPSPELTRVDSVTARSVIALATALGIDVLYESVTPADLDGLEIWAVSALHGIRIVTEWVDGPSPAEEPGRLATWRARLERLRRPLPEGAP
jgi:branched-subunit amino acid aminotransferase/4-amino-4-deoxychorismate lyase